MTQHEMVNIGIGQAPDTWLTDYIAPFPASCFATSEEEARRIFASAEWFANETPVRKLVATVENVRLL
jgi:hypothetical protein